MTIVQSQFIHTNFQIRCEEQLSGFIVQLLHAKLTDSQIQVTFSLMVGVELHCDAEVRHKVQMLSIYCLM